MIKKYVNDWTVLHGSDRYIVVLVPRSTVAKISRIAERLSIIFGTIVDTNELYNITYKNEGTTCIRGKYGTTNVDVGGCSFPMEGAIEFYKEKFGSSLGHRLNEVPTVRHLDSIVFE